MSFLDRLAAAVAPAASQEDIIKARQKAEQIGMHEQWLGTIVDQHKQIEALMEQVISGSDANSRREALREFGKLLTGHSTAEEVVIYPDIAEESSKTHAGMAYEEHAMTKIQVGALEKLDPMSDEWREKAEHIRSALEQHTYQEEDSWLPQLADKLPEAEKNRMEKRFIEEFERYCGSGSISDKPVGGMAATQVAL